MAAAWAAWVVFEGMEAAKAGGPPGRPPLRRGTSRPPQKRLRRRMDRASARCAGESSGSQTPEQPHPRGRAAGLDSDSLRTGLDGRTFIRSPGVGAGRRKHARCECASMVFPFDARRASVRWYWHR